MRIYSLALQNIGPFDDAKIEFLREGETGANVTLLTGQNGTGKTIVLDAIRGFFGGNFAKIERAIWRDKTPFVVEMNHSFHRDDDARPDTLRITSRNGEVLDYGPVGLWLLANDLSNQDLPPPWIVDFWRSQLAPDSHAIQSLQAVNHRALYRGSLQGAASNSIVTQLLCHFDYLRDSRTPSERATGDALYKLAERIVQLSTLDGSLVGIERLSFTPKVTQGGHEVPLANLSSGNAYLVQRMISLLGRMYSLHVLRGSDPSEIHLAPGLLLIDEAENHLHPTWQKRLIPNIRALFPNLQIIAATHSPFVLSSVPDARVYVCRYDQGTKKTTIEEQTAAYQNKAVDEILMSPAFDGVSPFSENITKLLDERHAAIERSDDAERKRIEKQLVALNPTRFAYLDLESQLEALKRAS